MCNPTVWLIIQWSLCWGRWPRAKTSTCRQTVSPSPHHFSSPSPLLLATSPFPLSPPPLLCSPPLFLPHSLCKDEKPCWCWWSPPCPPPPPPPPCKVSVMDRSISFARMLKIGNSKFWNLTDLKRDIGCPTPPRRCGSGRRALTRQVETCFDFSWVFQNHNFAFETSLPCSISSTFVQPTLPYKHNHFQYYHPHHPTNLNRESVRDLRLTDEKRAVATSELGSNNTFEFYKCLQICVHQHKFVKISTHLCTYILWLHYSYQVRGWVWSSWPLFELLVLVIDTNHSVHLKYFWRMDFFFTLSIKGGSQISRFG